MPIEATVTFVPGPSAVVSCHDNSAYVPTAPTAAPASAAKTVFVLTPPELMNPVSLVNCESAVGLPFTPVHATADAVAALPRMFCLVMGMVYPSTTNTFGLLAMLPIAVMAAVGQNVASS